MPDAPIPLASQIIAVEREIKFRRRVYPRQIEAGRMTATSAAYEIAAMEAVLETLRAVEKGERLI